ncbi:lysylphosphatidylglycerol synthase domain-containing protein [Paraflavisolibacter sp. H34]|uniref:lysylphosphatidylglycerol synthase domain-containing protein n=1 Tax=Huijunlia imazamoxiresistens TaxID=3127457 RepID=UPI00301A4B97
MQPNKSIKIFLNYFLGPVLFLWLSVSIYQQILHQSRLGASWLHIRASVQSSKIVYLVLVLALMFVNWSLEAWKWKLSVATIYPISLARAVKAVLSGVSFSVTTPNRVGEYLGRMLYLPEGSRLKSISVTLVGSLSQLLVTFICGLAGFIFLRNELIAHGFFSPLAFRFAFWGLVAVIALLAMVYFQVAFLEQLLEKWVPRSKYLYLVQSLGAFDHPLLWRLLLLSFVRYTVFIVQYFLLFSLFQVAVPPGVVWCVVSVLFLAMAVIPSVALVEVGLRGEVSLQLMGIFSDNSLGVGLTSVTIWLINLILPAILGSILFLGLKVFKRKNETV